MKRWTSMLLLLCLLLGLFAGCSGPAQQTDTPETTGEAATQAPEPTDAPAETDAPEPAQSAEDYTLEREAGCNQLTFYWYNETGEYDDCDMWIWYPNADGRGYLFHPCDYGAMVVLNVPEDITEVGFIVRRGCSDPGGTSWGDATKDYDGDRFAQITGPDTEVYLKPGDAAMYMSDDGGTTVYQAKKFNMAGIVAMDQIKYSITPALRIESLDQVQVLDGDRQLPVTELSSLNNEVVTGVITVGEKLDLSKTYTVKIEGYEPCTAMPTQVFDSPEFEAEFVYDGDDLGAVIEGDHTNFKLWAPTASAVQLQLFAEGNDVPAYETLDMEKGDKGVWSVKAPCGHGTYYTYLVTTAAGTQEAVDPYARAVGVNGDRGMVIDLSQTNLAGFENDDFYRGIDSYNEAVIWEVHVRDFSNRLASSRFPGKYLAFTETGLKNASGEPAGLDYLQTLGITHVHLQPVYDYATVDETRLDEPQFNWGYDPKNYNAPEGSYSTDPYHGETRVAEFKLMVQALHEAGLGVVMDVVYNHTYSADSCLGRVVPYYYYRYTSSGELSNGSGCGNETASERTMFRKYMVDSVCYWAKEYHIDGFRFDLMALHDVETMQAIEAALHEINPNAIIYGEGWTGGTTTLQANLQANQKNISQITATGSGIGPVAVFNDVIRDGLKGSVFDAKDRGYINGNANEGTAAKVVFGLLGGEKTNVSSFGVQDNAVINYMACHDNHTLWDKLLASNPEASDEERMQMNRFGASLIMIGKGVPFFLAGEELLRTKGGDHNSYKSSDEVNNIDWDSLVYGSDAAKMYDFYQGLIHMRRANDFFTKADMACEIQPDGRIEITWTQNGAVAARGYVNPTQEPMNFEIPEGSWSVLLADNSPFTEPWSPISGPTTVAPLTVLVIVAN